MNEVHEIYTGISDKLEAMQYCENNITKLGYDLRTIMWIKTDNDGGQVFEVSYTRVVKASMK